MGRKAGPPKERRHVHLNVGDWDWLEQTYGQQGFTPSSIISKLLSAYRRRVTEKMAQSLDAASQQTEEIDVDLTIGTNTGLELPGREDA